MNSTATMPTQKSNQNQAKGTAYKPESGMAHGLRALFVDGLKDIYFAEKTLVTAIPKMVKNATSPELVEALTGHLHVTKEHVTRLEKVFAAVGEKPEAKKCEAIVGLVKEAEEIMSSTEKGMVRDAGIILAGQKVEHYEIATYGTLRTFAKTLGENEASALLQETLDEEKEADKKLTEIAESFVNEEAV